MGNRDPEVTHVGQCSFLALSCRDEVLSELFVVGKAGDGAIA